MGLVAFVIAPSSLAMLVATRAAHGDVDLTTKLDPTAPTAAPAPTTTALTPSSAVPLSRPSSAPTEASTREPAHEPVHPGGHGGGGHHAAEAPSSDPSTVAGDASAAPSASTSAAPADDSPLVARTVSIGVGDLEIGLRVPSDWPELADDALPPLDDAKSEDVTIVTRKGFGIHRPKDSPAVVREVVIVCGKASGALWADSIRDAAFTAMTAGVEKVVGNYASIGSIEPDPIETRGKRLQQTFAAAGPFSTDARTDVAATGTKKRAKSADTVKVKGLSTLGFADDGKGRAIVACSVACAELVSSGDKGVCGEVSASVSPKGAWLAAPERSRIADLLFSLRANPTVAWLVAIGGVFVLLALVIVIVVVVRRRRAPRAGNGETDAATDDEEDDGDSIPPSSRVAPPGQPSARAVPSANALQIAQSSHPTPNGAPTGTLIASAPPPNGYVDPSTLAR